jgi:Flp pilus assembly protein TadG
MGQHMRPSRGSGRKRGLTFGSRSADKGAMYSSGAPAVAPACARRSRERGQALVEFALIVPLFLFIVVGIIQFGIALNYWLDLQRLANQGARYAVVDHGWENCDKAKQGMATCDDPPGPTLQDYLKKVRTSGGNTVQAKVTFETATPAVGQSVTVKVASCYRLLAILDMAAITLRGTATMRIEQPPSNYGGVGPGNVVVGPNDNDTYADNPCSDPAL